MGDALRKVQSGDPLKIPAATFNTFVDAARDYLQRQQNQGGAPLADARPAGVVLVKNLTGADRGLFEIVGLDGPVYTPDDNEPEFKFRFALKGVVPDSDHFGRFAILLEPVKDGAIGRALVQGITPVLVRVPDLGEHESGEYADINTAEGDLCAHLVAGPRGAAFILWLADKDPELPEGDPDIRWAIVRVSSATPADAAAAIHTLKVTGVWGAYGVPFDPDVHPFIAFVTGYFAFSDKAWVDESTEFCIKATNLPDDARVGFKNIQVGDFIGYAMLDGFEPVPGGPDDATYAGQVIAFPGPEGALLSTAQNLIGGPGILVEPNPDPSKDEPKVSVELADTDPGLEFTPTQDPDDGQLRVKPDSDQGIDVGAAGVKVIPNEDAGITVDADGIAVIPNTNVGIDVDGNGVFAKVDDLRGVDVDPTGIFAKVDVTRGIDVDAQGLFVIVNTNQGIDVDAQGVKALADATRAVSITQDGIGVDVDPNYALTVSGNKLQVVVKTAGGVELTDGALDIPEHADGGLEHREDGRLGIKIKDTSLQTETSGLSVLLDTTKGLALATSGIQVKLASNPQLAFDATGGGLKHDGPQAEAHNNQVYISNAGANLGVKLDANHHLIQIGVQNYHPGIGWGTWQWIP